MDMLSLSNVSRFCHVRSQKFTGLWERKVSTLPSGGQQRGRDCICICLYICICVSVFVFLYLYLYICTLPSGSQQRGGGDYRAGQSVIYTDPSNLLKRCSPPRTRVYF